MIIGNGIDVIEVERVRRNIEKERFLKKVYTKKEIEYLNSRKMNPQTAAGIFAAKEAVSKCIGTGFDGFGPLEIEILKDEKGKPIVNLLNNAQKIAKNSGITTILVSIAHIKDIAVATAVAQ